MVIPLYSWSKRPLDIVEIHSPRLWRYLKEHQLVPEYREWVTCPDWYGLAEKAPGLVSVSRSHWNERVWTEGDWERYHGQDPTFDSSPIPNKLFIGNIAVSCRVYGHVAFSRDKLLRTDGTFGEFVELCSAIETHLLPRQSLTTYSA
jgi:hypothetical protein